MLITHLKKFKLPIYLAVLKRLSSRSQGILSFPFSSYTLSLDIPYSDILIQQLTHMDEMIIEHQGRVYLAKDARMQAEHFKAMYPTLSEWQNIKSKIDPNHLFQSELSQRLEITHDI